MLSYDELQKQLERDWVSQTEAARLRGVTRQAISRLVQLGRLRCLRVGGYTLVLRKDAVEYKPEKRGRPRKAWQ